MNYLWNGRPPFSRRRPRRQLRCCVRRCWIVIFGVPDECIWFFAVFIVRFYKVCRSGCVTIRRNDLIHDLMFFPYPYTLQFSSSLCSKTSLLWSTLHVIISIPNSLQMASRSKSIPTDSLILMTLMLAWFSYTMNKVMCIISTIHEYILLIQWQVKFMNITEYSDDKCCSKFFDCRSRLSIIYFKLLNPWILSSISMTKRYVRLILSK